MAHQSKSPISRRQFLRLAGTIAVGTVTAACGAPAATPPAGSLAPTSAGATAPAVAAAPVKLIYKFPGTTQKDLGVVQDALSALLQEKIGATIELQMIDWGAYEEKVRLSNAAGEKYDLVYAPPWINNYYDNVSKGAFLPLDDLLKQQAPALWAAWPETTWDAARVQGQIYGVIQGNIWAKLWGPYIRKDLAEKYKLDLNAITKAEDLEPFLEQVKQGEGIVPLYITKDEGIGGLWRGEYNGYDPLVDIQAGIGVRFDDPTLTAVLMPATPEYQAAAELAHKWYQAGYYPEEALPAVEANALFKAGKYAVQLHLYKPGGADELKAKFGYDFVSKPLGPKFLTTAGVVASLTCIPKVSDNPEAAIKFLELINTDPVAYNLLAKGIEGKHWVWVDKAKRVIGLPPGLTAETAGYTPSTDWMFGNQFNAYFVTPEQAAQDVWNATKKINAEAQPSVALGFAFIADPVKAELAQITAVGSEFGPEFGIGRPDPAEALPQYLAKLKDAGVDKVLAEVQKQLTEWKAAKS